MHETEKLHVERTLFLYIYVSYHVLNRLYTLMVNRSHSIEERDAFGRHILVSEVGLSVSMVAHCSERWCDCELGW